MRSSTPSLGVIESLGLLVVPYIVLLLVPVLGRMSDPDPQVRLMATHCFAALVRLMPLDVSSNLPRRSAVRALVGWFGVAQLYAKSHRKETF